MIKEDLVAERIAIDSYSEIVRFLGERDVTTRRMMKRSWRTKRSMPTT
jgi:bacterioferritin